MKKEWHIVKLDFTHFGIKFTDQDEGEHFKSKEQAEEFPGKALPKGSYMILEVIVIED